MYGAKCDVLYLEHGKLFVEKSPIFAFPIQQHLDNEKCKLLYLASM